MTVVAHEVSRRAHPSAAPLLDAPIPPRPGGISRGQGTLVTSVRGNLYLIVGASPGCSWRVTALRGLRP